MTVVVEKVAEIVVVAWYQICGSRGEGDITTVVANLATTAVSIAANKVITARCVRSADNVAALL